MQVTGATNIWVDRGLGSHEAEYLQRVKAPLDWLLGGAMSSA
jgi:hypothetical protein